MNSTKLLECSLSFHRKQFGLNVAWLSLFDHRPDIIRQRKLEEFEERKHNVDRALRSWHSGEAQMYLDQ